MPCHVQTLPVYIEGQRLDESEFAVKSCKGDKDKSGQYVLFYVDFNVSKHCKPCQYEIIDLVICLADFAHACLTPYVLTLAS